MFYNASLRNNSQFSFWCNESQANAIDFRLFVIILVDASGGWQNQIIDSNNI